MCSYNEISLDLFNLLTNIVLFFVTLVITTALDSVQFRINPHLMQLKDSRGVSDIDTR